MKARLESISFSIDTILQDIPHYSRTWCKEAKEYLIVISDKILQKEVHFSKNV